MKTATNDAVLFLDLIAGKADSPVWLPVLSGSMHPTLVPGDSVLIHPCDWKKIVPGDIIIFREGMSLTAHRLIWRGAVPGRMFLYQQGDGMPSGGFILQEQIVGKCMAYRRNGAEQTLTDKENNKGMVRKCRRRFFRGIPRRITKWLLRKVRITR